LSIFGLFNELKNIRTHLNISKTNQSSQGKMVFVWRLPTYLAILDADVNVLQMFIIIFDTFTRTEVE